MSNALQNILVTRQKREIAQNIMGYSIDKRDILIQLKNQYEEQLSQLRGD